MIPLAILCAVQVAAQRAIIARAEARKPKRCDAEWGRE